MKKLKTFKTYYATKTKLYRKNYIRISKEKFFIRLKTLIIIKMFRIEMPKTLATQGF